MADKLQWGILGTGAIATTFAKALLHSRTGSLAAVASRSPQTAAAFGTEFLHTGAICRCGSYEELLAKPEVQAVYIATPHPTHARLAIAAARAGKHILCEKPLAMNAHEAQAIVAAAQQHKVFLMEAFMYRCHPVVHRLVQLLQQKVIGEVRAIQANFGFQSGGNYHSRLLNRGLGGGGILDVGCYTMSLARLVAGTAAGEPFANPTAVHASGYVGPSGVDEWTFADVQFNGGIAAALGCGVSCEMNNHVHIFGSEGRIEIPWLWIPQPTGNRIILHRRNEKPREEVIKAPADVYTLEADIVAAAVSAGAHQAAAPAMSWADTLGNMLALDQWRACLGVTYAADEVPLCG